MAARLRRPAGRPDGRRSWPTGSPCSDSSSRRCTRRAPTSPGRCVVGRVLEFDAEEHSNGKTIRWCQVDVGEGEPRGIVCGAPNFAVGDLVVVGLPGCRAARRVRDRGAQDLRPCQRRHDLLGPRARSRRRPHRHHRARPDTAQPGDDAAEVLHLRDDVIEFEINPDRAYALSLRGVAREAAAGLRPAVQRPCADAARCRGWRRLPGVDRRPSVAATRSSLSRSTASTRPRRRRGGWRDASSWRACGRSRSPSTSPTTSCSSSASRSMATTRPRCKARSSYAGRGPARS